MKDGILVGLSAAATAVLASLALKFIYSAVVDCRVFIVPLAAVTGVWVAKQVKAELADSK